MQRHDKTYLNGDIGDYDVTRRKVAALDAADSSAGPQARTPAEASLADRRRPHQKTPGTT
jgi:hypothetical protein